MSDPARRFRSTTAEGLDHGAFPMRLWQKAKRLGVWNPVEIDLTADARHWQDLDADEQDLLLRLSALFQAGEEAVTLDLLPLIQVVAAEGRLEEEIYLTSFLYEEAKHVETFRRFFDEVAEEPGDLSRYETPAYRRIFHEALPGALQGLREDASPVAQARAAVVYNMIVEGVLAETGYHAYHAMLSRQEILPGMQEAVRLVKRDESRHLAFGIYFLSRLVAEGGDAVADAVDAAMAELLEPAIELINEIFAAYDEMPFGLEISEFTGFAVAQFQRRLARLQTAREEGLEDALLAVEAEELAGDESAPGSPAP